ncbi:MAG TPA: AAA family ATPase [Actinomycetota bacterium]|nr:AAA family ATPase [Actinomycetota bacterium]
MTPATCETCGFPLPPDARFCPRCGTPVGVPTTQERKLVTIVFADLAGSTELASRLDPERYREVIGDFYSMVSVEMESLRGRVEKFVGDAVMTVFGLPLSHEDDALRAVRAAVLIRDRTVRLGEELGLPVPLRVRVGVNSGPVATGSGPVGQFLVTGAPVNLAARLQEAAEPGEVLVGETTRQLTRNSVEFGERRMLRHRGLPQELAAWPVRSLTSRSSRRTIPLVGRHYEVALLTNTFDRVRQAKRPHLVTVVGEPGIGKSRLVEEFLAGLPSDVKVLVGHTAEHEEDVTYAPLAEMIRRELDVGWDTPPAEVRKRLEDLVSGCCDASEVEKVTGRLGLAVGLGSGKDPADSSPKSRDNGVLPDSAAEFDPSRDLETSESRRYRNAEIRAGLTELLHGMGRRTPVVMVFEDMHRAQSELLDLIESLLNEGDGLPLLVLCLARDELLQERHGWGAAADSLTLRLDPLSVEEAMELATVTGDNLDEQTAEHVARHAGGNPFFIIETTAMLLQEHAEHFEGILHGHVLPPTVQAVVAARMDHLPEAARDLARKASVFPRSMFTVAELSLITAADSAVLTELEDAELLVRDRERRDAWRFRHDVLRTVAYESLPKRERLRLHLQVADGISAWGEERNRQAIAYHLEQAALASLDLDPTDRSIADRAIRALRRAGDVARRRMESRTAIDLYERALALAGPKEQWGESEAQVVSFIGESRYWLGEYDAARGALQRALKIGGRNLWVRAHASRFLADITLNIEGDVDRASPLFDQALEAAREIDDPWITARTLLMAGWAPYWRGDLRKTREMFEEALDVTRKNEEEDLWAEARALTSLTSVVSVVGDEGECLSLGEEALALGRKMDDPFTIAVAQETVGNSLRRMMRLSDAFAALDESVRLFRELGARWELASALGDRGRIHWLAMRFDLAETDVREALDLCFELEERNLIAWTAGQLMLIQVSAGKRPEARAVSEEIADIVESGTAEWRSGLEGLWMAEAALALAEGERDVGLEFARRAWASSEEQGWRNELASVVWWIGALFGPEAVGGQERLDDARRTLEAAQWRHAFEEPERVKGALSSVSSKPA